MSPLAVIAQFEISRPTSGIGWLILIAMGILLLFILNQGVMSLVGMARVPLKRNLFFFVGLIAVLFAYNTRDNWGSDPIGRVDVLPNDGTVQLNGSDGSADHSHDSVN